MDIPDARTLPGLLAEMANRHPERNFVTDETRRVSYSELLIEARGLAKGLHTLGVRHGSKVAILMGNQVEWIVVCFAVTMLGGVLVAVNTWWRQRELHHALSISDSTLLIMVDRYGSNDYTAALHELGDLKVEFPFLQNIVCLGKDAPPGARAYADLPLLGQAVTDDEIDLAVNAVRPEDVAYILFTSGSTSKSKAVQLQHRGLVENGYGIGERQHLDETDRVLLVVSMFWSYACANALVAAMTHGAALVLQYRYDPSECLRLIEAERCTTFYTQPNMVMAIYAHPDRKTRDLTSLHKGICRSEVLHLMAEMGAQNLCTSYGLTECYGNSCVSDSQTPFEVRRHTSGKPLPNTVIEIVDPKTRDVMPVGEVGEVRIRGYVMVGYYNDPVRTAEAIDEWGWFYTGDLGVLDADGFFQFRGRLKEMIKTGGINVTPADVEELLLDHASVQQAIVVGVPDRERDEIVAAMVVAKAGMSLTAEELVNHCRSTAAVYKVPRFLRFVKLDEVPLTETGKVHKNRVQEILTEQHRLATQT